MNSPVRAYWKAAYRALRIARREAFKSFPDLMCYGTAVVYIGADARPDGVAEYIPLNKFMRAEDVCH